MQILPLETSNIVLYLIFGLPRRSQVSDPVAEGCGHLVLGQAFVGTDAVVHPVNLLKEVLVHLKFDLYIFVWQVSYPLQMMQVWVVFCVINLTSN